MEQKDNCMYSRVYGYPYLISDYIELEKNVEYEIKVICEQKDYEYDFFPEIEVPKYMGYIKTREPAVSSRGKKRNIMPILVCTVDMDYRESVIKYMSELGGLVVTFCCQFHYKEMGPKVIVTYHGDPGHRVKMLKEKISDNKARYICRAPYETERDNLIFTVEWNKVEL